MNNNYIFTNIILMQWKYPKCYLHSVKMINNYEVMFKNVLHAPSEIWNCPKTHEKVIKSKFNVYDIEYDISVVRQDLNTFIHALHT